MQMEIHVHEVGLSESIRDKEKLYRCEGYKWR